MYVDDIIDSLGFGWFSCKLMFVIGVVMLSDSSETNLISLVSPELRCTWQLSSLQTSFMSSTVFVGEAIGSVYSGYLADKYGRKWVMIAGTSLALYFGLLSAASPNYVWFAILRFFVGIGLSAALCSGLCYITEFITKKHRGKWGMGTLGMFYAFGSAYISAIALLLMNACGWRVFILVATIPGAVGLLMLTWLPKSVRHLQNTCDYDTIMKILQRVSHGNNKPLPSIVNVKHATTSKRGNIAILFRKENLWKLAISTMLLTTTFCGYFGLTLFNTEALQLGVFSPQNRTRELCHVLTSAEYLQNIFVVLAEFPGLIFLIVTIDLIGRKGLIFPGLLASGIGFLLINVRLTGISGTILMFVLRGLLTAISFAASIYSAELFPTVIRASATGIAYGICRISLIGVPFLVQTLAHVSLLATSVIFAGLCFVSAAFVLFLPETNNKPLLNN